MQNGAGFNLNIANGVNRVGSNTNGDAEAYSFTYTAEDEEGNSSVRKTSITIS